MAPLAADRRRGEVFEPLLDGLGDFAGDGLQVALRDSVLRLTGLPARRIDELEQVGRADVQRAREPDDGVQPGIPGAAFDLSDGFCRQARALSQLFLRELQACAGGAKRGTEPRTGLVQVNRLLWRHYVKAQISWKPP